MRLAIAISVWAAGCALGLLRADDAFAQVTISERPAYIVTEKYGNDHKAAFLASFTNAMRTVDFWTPSEDNIQVAERTFRQWIHDGAQDPAQIYPEMTQHPENYSADLIQHEKDELALVDKNYDSYTRQFVGIMVNGHRMIVCNYSVGTSIDPSINYIFIQKSFEPNKGMHFLQAWFDPDAKTCSNLAMVGSWQGLPVR